MRQVKINVENYQGDLCLPAVIWKKAQSRWGEERETGAQKSLVGGGVLYYNSIPCKDPLDFINN
jgi:hypothetical protein